MATRKAGIGAELRMDTRGWKAGIDKGRNDLLKFKQDAAGVRIAPSSGGWTELNSKLQIAGVAMRGLGLAGRAIGSLFKSDMGIEGLSRSLAAVTRDSQSLQSQMDDLMKVAAGPGIDFSSAVQGSAALQSVGLSAKESREALEQWSNAVASSAGGAEELKGVITALRQILSKPTVQQEDVNQILERVGSFAAVAAKLENLKAKPAEWVKNATAELAKMPRVAAGAKESVDGLKDAWEQWKIGASGGRASAAGSAFMDYGAKVLKNGFNAKDFEALGGGLQDAFSPQKKNPLTALQPSEKDIQDRQKAWLESQETIRKNRETMADKQLKSLQGELDLQKQLAEARLGHDRDAIKALEEKIYLMEHVENLAKQMGVSEQFVTDRLKERLKTEREIEEIGRRDATAHAETQSKADMLRFRGKNKQADKLERKEREGNRVNELLDTTNLSREDAQRIAHGESVIQSGRKRISGARAGQNVDKYGFATTGNPNTDGGMKSRASGLITPKSSDDQPFSMIPYFKDQQADGTNRVKSVLNEKRKAKASGGKSDSEASGGIGADFMQTLRQIEQNTRDSRKTPAEKHAPLKR